MSSSSTNRSPEEPVNEQTNLLGSAGGPSEDHGTLKYLYVSHFLSTWNSRLFEYGAALFLAEIFLDTFTPLSVYAFVRALAPIFLSHKVGQYMKVTARLKTVRSSIIYQRIAVAISCLSLLAINSIQKREVDLGPNQSYYALGIFVVTVAMACIEKLSSTLNLLSVERDWVVVIADGDHDLLRVMNSQMRRLDLSCKLGGPLAISFLDSFAGVNISLVVILLWNIVSLLFEYYFLKVVHARYRGIQQPKIVDQEAASQENNSIWKHFGEYFKNPMFAPSMALSLLYLTVLSFGPLMIEFLLFESYTPALVGILRGVSVCFELSATVIAPWMMQKVGPLRSGLWFINLQAVCLVGALVASWDYLGMQNSLWGTLPLIVGVTLSRLGLWGFDLSVQIQLQESVPSEQMSHFSTTEAAFQNFFELLSYVTTLIWSKPSEFRYPVAISSGAVLLAVVFYAKYLISIRHHLLHLEKLRSYICL